MEQNKTGKYFKYAIGEIVLVMIGILLALQVNNWNQQRIQNKEEQLALVNLKQDFEYNNLELNRIIRELNTNLNATQVIINHTGNRSSDAFDIDSLLQFTPYTFRYFPKNGFLMDLINSGNLGIIQNDNLRNKISSWLPELETLKNREELSIDFDNDLIRYVMKNGSWLNVDGVTTDIRLKELKLPESGFNIDNNDLLKNIEFENMIENQLIFQMFLIERQEICLELNNEIINLLESEIKK